MADIFTMIRASKFYGAERKVLDEITLTFLPGADGHGPDAHAWKGRARPRPASRRSALVARVGPSEP